MIIFSKSFNQSKSSKCKSVANGAWIKCIRFFGFVLQNCTFFLVYQTAMVRESPLPLACVYAWAFLLIM